MTRDITDNPGGWQRSLPGHTVEYDADFANPFHNGSTVGINAGATGSFSLGITDDYHIFFPDMISISPQAYKEFACIIYINDVPYVAASGIGWLNIPLRQNPSIQLITGDVLKISVINLDASARNFIIDVNGTKIIRPANFGHAPGAIYTTVADHGAAPFAIECTDTSIHTPTAWDWDFGDGSPHQYTSHVHHTFTVLGTYYVVLKVSNQYGWDTFAWAYVVT